MKHFDTFVSLTVATEVCIAAAAGLLFVIIYHLRWKWWKSYMGRHMMTFMAGLDAILLLAVVNMFWPGMPGRVPLRLFAWTVIAVLFTWRLIVLVEVRREDPPTIEQIDNDISALQKVRRDLFQK